MAFTRNFLKSTGLTDEQISAVMEEHVAVVDGLKADRDSFKEKADKADELQKQLDEIANGENFQQKYEDEHKAFEDYKTKVAQDEQKAKIESAFRDLLADEKISGGKKRIDAIVKATDLSGMKLTKDGKLDGEEKIRKAINDDWGEFKTTVTERGAVVDKPPQIGKPQRTRDEIMSIKDTKERQKAISENHELFGF